MRSFSTGKSPPTPLVVVEKIKSLGFKPQIPLKRGIEMTINQYKNIKSMIK